MHILVLNGSPKGSYSITPQTVLYLQKRYIQDNCQNLGLKFVRGLSADMDDLLSDKGRRDAEAFFDYLCWSMMKADHKFYKSHGQYDFPQKQWPTMLKMYLVGALLSSEKIKSKMGNAMNEGMLVPYRKVLDNME